MTNDNISTYTNDEERERLITKLVDELPVLRTKLGISQDELASLLGVTRQTYSSIETKKRKMSWSIYLSLILIFDYSDLTHDIIRKAGLFPQKMFLGRATTREEEAISSFVQMEGDDLKNHLDEQAIHAIETVIMVEYARCNKMTSEAVIKAFDGKRLSQVSQRDVKVKNALENIKAGSDKKK
jgi:DNA-binding XRE family transcriptional regulator